MPIDSSILIGNRAIVNICWVDEVNAASSFCLMKSFNEWCIIYAQWYQVSLSWSLILRKIHQFNENQLFTQMSSMYLDV